MTYSKHLHVLAAPLNVFFATLEPKGRFRTVDLENAETFGVGEITEFTWKDLFDTYNCTECGRCTSRCPANMSGKELDPTLLILHLQDRTTAERSSATSSTIMFSGRARCAAGAWTRARSSSSTCRRSRTCGASSC